MVVDEVFRGLNGGSSFLFFWRGRGGGCENLQDAGGGDLWKRKLCSRYATTCLTLFTNPNID